MIILAWFLIQAASPAQPTLRSQLDQSLLTQVEQLERDYQVKMVFDQNDFPKQRLGSYLIRGHQASLKAVHEYLPMFIREWRLYPTTLVTNTKLRFIVFGSNFKLPLETRGRNAIPDYHHDAMFYDVSLSLTGELYRKYLLEIIHHEFFHFIDYKDDGEVYEDKVWKKLSPPEFKYGRGGYSVQSDFTQGFVTDKIPGFITRYATSGVEEDKAEVFRCMLVNLRELEVRAETDLVLSNKIARMKTLLYTFCPELDEPYWQRLRDMERPPLTMSPYQDQWAKNHPAQPPVMPSTTVTTTAIEYCPPPARNSGRVTLYDLSKQGYGSVLSYSPGSR